MNRKNLTLRFAQFTLTDSRAVKKDKLQSREEVRTLPVGAAALFPLQEIKTNSDLLFVFY